MSNETNESQQSSMVVHEPEKARFVRTVDGEEVTVRYALSDGVLDITSTFTPPALRRRGLAREVVVAAIDHAAHNQLKVVASCWYGDRVIKEFRAAIES